MVLIFNITINVNFIVDLSCKEKLLGDILYVQPNELCVKAKQTRVSTCSILESDGENMKYNTTCQL